MGQYYIAGNLDKKQRFEFDGLKLMEFSWVGNKSMQAFAALMDGAWKGDCVYVVGDYADMTEGSYEGDDAWLPQLEAALRELGIVGATYVSDGREYPYSLYRHIVETFEDVTEDAMKLAADGAELRYILNPELGVYIDLEHCPADSVSYWAEEDEAFAWRVHPLSLLLAMGNGRGGGDFKHGICKPFVDMHAERRSVKRSTQHPFGAWCETVSAIRFAKAGEESKLEGLQEWEPCFAETETPIGWQDVPARIAEVLAKGQADKKD